MGLIIKPVGTTTPQSAAFTLYRWNYTTSVVFTTHFLQCAWHGTINNPIQVLSTKSNDLRSAMRCYISYEDVAEEYTVPYPDCIIVVQKQN